jgi:hypothetical protein
MCSPLESASDMEDDRSNTLIPRGLGYQNMILAALGEEQSLFGWRGSHGTGYPVREPIKRTKPALGQGVIWKTTPLPYLPPPLVVPYKRPWASRIRGA